MPDLSAFALMLVIAYVVPGPDFAVVLASTARGLGPAAAAGVVTGLLVHATLAAAGVSSLLAATSWGLPVLRGAGGTFLLWTGLALLEAARRGTAGGPDAAGPPAGTTRAAAWRRGLLTNLLNPKTLLFFLALIPQFVDASAPVLPQVALLAGITVAAGALWWTLVVRSAARLRPFLERARVRRRLDAGTGLSLVGLAAWSCWPSALVSCLAVRARPRHLGRFALATVFGVLDLSWFEFALCCVAAGAGAVVQGVLGFGYALLVVPALLVVAPAAVPSTALVVALPMVVALALSDLPSVERRTVGRLTLGRLPGTLLGALLLGVLAPVTIAGTAGAFLLLAVAFSVVRGPGHASPRLEIAAGFVSGLAGTVGAVGGPYLGLVVADRPGPVLRATVSAAFALGIVLSLVAVGAAGELSPPTTQLGLALVPATFLGLPVGHRLTHRLRGPQLRTAVLGVAGAAGLFALLRAVL